MTVEEARLVVHPMMVRSASHASLSLSALDRQHERHWLGDELEYREFDRETQWAWLILSRWNVHTLRDIGFRWSESTFTALERLYDRVEARKNDRRESTPKTSFDHIHPDDTGDPFGERWLRSDGAGVGDNSYTFTDRPNHTLVEYRDGKPVYESNAAPLSTDDESEVRRLLELDATNEGFTSFAEYVASPGRGRASTDVGARLDALSRSTRRLLDLGYDRATIGAVVGRDKRRLSELENRTRNTIS